MKEEEIAAKIREIIADDTGSITLICIVEASKEEGGVMIPRKCKCCGKLTRKARCECGYADSDDF